MDKYGNLIVYTNLTEIFNPCHSALIVVDVQNDFCHPDGHFARYGKNIKLCTDIVTNIVGIVNIARNANVKVVWVKATTEINYLSDSPAWLSIKMRDGNPPNFTLRGSWGREIVQELKPNNNENVIDKYRNSAFHKTILDKVLKANNIESLVICGVQTEGCVMATVIDAVMHDYYVGLVEDCVATSNVEMHDVALQFMRSRFKILNVKLLKEMW